MIQPGMMFGGEGPVMQGTWYNPQTGDAFTVRDSFFEDNQYVVTTTDGRYLNYNQLQNYVQSDMKLEDLKKNRVQRDEPVPAEIMDMIANDDLSEVQSDDYFGIIPEDMDIISDKSKPMGNIYAAPESQTLRPTQSQPVQNLNTTIIEKALKNTSKPTFSINVKWPNYPAKEIEMLKDIMEIPINEIANWYLDSISLDEFVTAFKVAIQENVEQGGKYTEITTMPLGNFTMPTTEEKCDFDTAPEMIKDKVKEETNTEKKPKAEKKSKRALKAAKK